MDVDEDAVSRELLASSILQHAQDAIIAKDLDGRIISWNDGAQALYGHSAAEVLGKPMSVLGPPGKWFEVLSVIRRIANGVRIENYETTRVRKDGTEVRVSVTVSPIKDSAGHIIGVVTIDRDVSFRELLRDPLSLAAPADPAAVVIDKDLSGNICAWTPAAAGFYGYSADEVLGKPIALIIPEDRVSEMSDLIDAVRGGTPVHGVHTNRLTKHGKEVKVVLDVLPLLDSDGHLAGVRSVATPDPTPGAG